MSEDLPTTPAPPRSLSSFVRSAVQFVDVIKWAATTLAAVCASLFSANAWIENNVVTEAELAQVLAQRLKPVDDNAKALLERVLSDEEARRAAGVVIEAQSKDLDRQRLDLWWSWWWFTGIQAAELERDKRKADRAAAVARDRFEEYARQGMPLEEAFRRALRRGMP